jgi:hypothetical protein
LTQTPEIERSTPEELAARRRASKLRQIRALMLAATDETKTEGFRENAMARAMALMAEHGVTEMMLGALEEKRSEKIIVRKIDLSGSYTFEQMTLLGTIANALGCRYNYNHRRDTVYFVRVIGHETDVERTELLFTSLLLQALNGVKNERPTSYWATRSDTRQHRKSWLRGFAYRVGERIEAAEARARGDYDKAHDGPGTALVLVDRDALVQKFYDEMFGHLKVGKHSRQLHAAAVHAGAQAGSTADIGDPRLSGGRPALPPAQ